MSLIEFLSNSFIGSRRVRGVDFEKISPDFLLQKKTEMGIDKYIKWLKRENTVLASCLYERKERNLPIESSWIEALRKIEKEFDNLEKENGAPIRFSRMSDNF